MDNEQQRVPWRPGKGIGWPLVEEVEVDSLNEGRGRRRALKQYSRGGRRWWCRGAAEQSKAEQSRDEGEDGTRSSSKEVQRQRAKEGAAAGGGAGAVAEQGRG